MCVWGCVRLCVCVCVRRGEISKHLIAAAVMHMLGVKGMRADTSLEVGTRKVHSHQLFHLNSSHVSSSSGPVWTSPSPNRHADVRHLNVFTSWPIRIIAQH